jgi:hypothetical protein
VAVRESSYLPYNILKAMVGTRLCLRERRNSQKLERMIPVIEMKLDITIYIEGRRIKVPHGEPYEITCKKESTAAIMIGD